MNTKKAFFASIAQLFILATLSGTSLAGETNGVLCVDKQVISALDIGWNYDNPKGPDGGASIELTFENGQVLPVEIYSNMNDNHGEEIHDTLLHAMKSKFLVTAWDHRTGKDCSDLDEFKIERNPNK